MNIYYLKKIRKAVWDKYKIQKWDFTDKPWHICDKFDTSLPYSDFDSYDGALKSLMYLWHKEAKKFLWENLTKRKIHKKTYPW